jgi:putative membrane protein
MKNVLMAVADRGGRDGMMGRGHDGFGWVFPLVCLVIFVAAAAVLVWLLMRGRNTAASGAPTAAAPVVQPAPNPLAGAEAILAERLARGEISPDDYRAAAAALRGQPVDAPTG